MEKDTNDGARDPVERELGDEEDLYDVSTWEERTWLDSVAVGFYRQVVRGTKLLTVGAALLILVGQLAITAVAVTVNPVLGVFTLLSTVPAFLLAGYVWVRDVTVREPLKPLVVTFLLAVVFAGFAAVINSSGVPFFSRVPFVGAGLFFLLVVAPVEETVKMLAVRMYAYEERWFDAVIDGAVYGAVAGLGFATIENSAYITSQFLATAQSGTEPLFGATAETAFVRSLVGPGHVIYSSIAGYYMGLAKFNPENAGPIVAKGILIAGVIHGGYNTLVTYLPQFIEFTPLVFVSFIVLYDTVFGLYLFSKISRYSSAYRRATGSREG
ncbi:MAG: PrsW family intramembrane metalloprotease [Halobacteria archaeon]|nr:PrsW family intramembrane metalloprotease [Halobacteria archaeon]